MNRKIIPFAAIHSDAVDFKIVKKGVVLNFRQGKF
jgi:hypothetical protein